MKVYVHDDRVHVTTVGGNTEVHVDIMRSGGADLIRRVESWLEIDLGDAKIILFERADQERFVSACREFLAGEENGDGS